MTPIDKYTENEKKRLLLQGCPGSGKTTLVCGFPKAYVVDIDVNLGGALRYRTNHGQMLPVGYDRIDIGPDGRKLDSASAFAKLDRCLVEAQMNPEVETIVIDSATGLADLMFKEVVRKNPSVKDGRQHYGFFLTDSRNLIATLTAMQKHVVLTAHERVEDDAMTQIKSFRVMWPGQLGDYLGAFFTNVWRCEVTQEGFPPKSKFLVRTMQDFQHYGLKNDIELPTILDSQSAITKLFGTSVPENQKTTN